MRGMWLGFVDLYLGACAASSPSPNARIKGDGDAIYPIRAGIQRREGREKIFTQNI